MMKLNVPKRVVLPNGRTLVARYKRISRAELPPNIVMHRTYRQRAAPRGHRRRQRGRGIFDFVKKVARNPLVCSLAKKRDRIRSGNLPKLNQKSQEQNFK